MPPTATLTHRTIIAQLSALHHSPNPTQSALLSPHLSVPSLQSHPGRPSIDPSCSRGNPAALSSPPDWHFRKSPASKYTDPTNLSCRRKPSQSVEWSQRASHDRTQTCRSSLESSSSLSSRPSHLPRNSLVQATRPAAHKCLNTSVCIKRKLPAARTEVECRDARCMCS